MKKFSMQDFFFFFVLIILSVAFLKVVSPFIIDIILAIIFASLFRKPFLFFNKKFKREKLASISALLMVIIVVAIPLTVVGVMVSSEAAGSYNKFMGNWPKIQETITPEYIAAKVENIPIIGKYIQDVEVSEFRNKISEIVTATANFTISIIQATFINISSTIVHFFIILFLLFYLLIDGKNLLVNYIYRFSPLSDNDEKEFADRLTEVTDAIIFNTFLVGIIEGLYGGLLFAFMGIGSPFFWGVLMVVLSMIPLVGANTILIPAVLIQIFFGNYLKAILLLVFGVGAILINQNIIKPKLDGNKSGLHPAVVFLASMGGILWLGIVGFIIGPLIAALFIVIWEQYGKRYQKELDEWNAGG